MVQLTHAHTVDTRPFLPHREGPGDEATHELVLVSLKRGPCAVHLRLGLDGGWGVGDELVLWLSTITGLDRWTRLT